MLTVDGVAQPTTLGWSATLTGARWAHLAGFGGYVFPGGATVKALREERTGAWRDINAGGATPPISRRYLTMWFDHGVNPTAGSYHYVLLPGADPTTTAARAATPQVSILANTAAAQAITDSATGTTAANLYAAGTVGPITATEPCSVLIRESGGTLRVAVADPTRAASTVTVTVNRAGYATASGEARITVLDTDPITLLVDVGGAHGASRTITFGTGGAVPPGRLTALTPTADAHVEDGASAGTNFGADPVLAIKNAAPGGTQARFEARAVAGDAWTEPGLTWNNQPVLGAALSSASTRTGSHST